MAVFTSAVEKRLWLSAAAVTVAIYATLGQAPAIANALRDRNLLDTTFFVTFLVVVAALIAVGLTMRPGWREVAVVVAVLSVYLLALLRFANPAERTHLVEFGVVAVLIYLAVLERRSHGRPVQSPAIIAFVTASILGVIDEGIQAILPNRVPDPIDIAFNVGAALMAITAVALLRWARSHRRPHRP